MKMSKELWRINIFMPSIASVFFLPVKGECLSPLSSSFVSCVRCQVATCLNNDSDKKREQQRGSKLPFSYPLLEKDISALLSPWKLNCIRDSCWLKGSPSKHRKHHADAHAWQHCSVFKIHVEQCVFCSHGRKQLCFYTHTHQFCRSVRSVHSPHPGFFLFQHPPTP